MITGNNLKRIKEYFSIDHCSEGFGYTNPKEGEELWGVPYGFVSENSTPFIQHMTNGKVTSTVNCADVSVIEFWD